MRNQYRNICRCICSGIRYVIHRRCSRHRHHLTQQKNMTADTTTTTRPPNFQTTRKHTQCKWRSALQGPHRQLDQKDSTPVQNKADDTEPPSGKNPHGSEVERIHNREQRNRENDDDKEAVVAYQPPDGILSSNHICPFQIQSCAAKHVYNWTALVRYGLRNPRQASSYHKRAQATTWNHLTQATTGNHEQPLNPSNHRRPPATTQCKQSQAATLNFQPKRPHATAGNLHDIRNHYRCHHQNSRD